MLLIIADHSVKGVRAVARIRDLVSELKLVVKRQAVVINRVPANLAPLIITELARLNIEPAAVIPEDEQIYQYDLELKPLLGLPDSSKAVRVVADLLAELLDKKSLVRG